MRYNTLSLASLVCAWLPLSAALPAKYSVIPVDGGSAALQATVTLPGQTIVALTTATVTDVEKKTVTATATYLVVNAEPTTPCTTIATIATQTIGISLAGSSSASAIPSSSEKVKSSVKASTAASSATQVVSVAPISSVMATTQSSQLPSISSSLSGQSLPGSTGVVGTLSPEIGSSSVVLGSTVIDTTASHASSSVSALPPTATSSDPIPTSIRGSVSSTPTQTAVSTSGSPTYQSGAIPSWSLLGTGIPTVSSASSTAVPQPTSIVVQLSSLAGASATVQLSSQTYDNGQWHTTYAHWNATATQAPAKRLQ